MRVSNPVQHFHEWFCQVRDQFPQVEVNAMALATLGLDGYPKSRMVLLKQYTWEGFMFYTQYTSEKGKAIKENSKVSLSFPWEITGKRIVITGIAEKIKLTQSEAYFETRPRGSQIGAWASQQSEPIRSREVLEDSYDRYEYSFRDKRIHKPGHWGGYLVKPVTMVFEEDQDFVIQKTNYTLSNDIDWEEKKCFLMK